MAAPDFFTVEEAARILRIGRTAAYLAAKRYRVTNGAEGLPCVVIRGSLRVPRRRLEVMAGGLLDGAPKSAASIDEHRDDDAPPAARRAAKPKRAAASDAQRPLPFGR